MRPGRLRTTLVYFGLLEDEAEARRIDEGPVNGWRVLAGTLFAAAVAGAVAWVLILLTGWDAHPLTFAVVAGALAGAGGVSEWRAARRRAREHDAGNA